MTENACQTSLDIFPLEEVKKLKEENFILQGKIRGYATLGSLLREKKEECAKLKKMNEELEKNLQNSPGAGNFSQEESSDNNHLMNGDTGIGGKKSGELHMHSVISENLDVSLKSGQNLNGTTEQSLKNKTQDLTKQNLQTKSWKEQISGVAYPPNDIFRDLKTDKYPTQESVSLHSDTTQDDTNSPKQQINVKLNSSENSLTMKEDCRNVVRSTSTVVNVGSENYESLNLIEFPPEEISDTSNKNPIEEVQTEAFNVSSNKNSASNFKVVKAPSSQSSSFQVLNQSLSRQGSKSETALSLHVSEMMNGDLGTDGPSRKMKKMLEDILPDLTKIEEENDNLKVENKRLRDENNRLLKKLQQLELQLNNLTPASSLSSQTQVVDWEYVTKTELPKNNLTEELSQKSDNAHRLHQLEQQNRDLLQANSRWERMFKEMRSDQDSKMKKHQLETDSLREQLTKMKLEDEKRRREYDHILLTTKNRLEDEESAKEALQAQLVEFQASCDQLQRENRELEETLNAVNREQLSREAELNVLRQGIGGNSIHTINLSSESDLRTEIAVLREQLTVFQEDFDRERQDRAKAQSEKDDLIKQLGKLRSENRSLHDQNKRHIAQLQTAEVNVKDAIEESTRLNSSNIELRNKVRQLESQLLTRPSTFMPNITAGRPTQISQPLMVQPETDPYARPSPPYLFQSHINQNNAQSNRERYPSEQQPGAWNCDDCTYFNHPSRTVCEMCGKIRTQGSSIAVQHTSTSPTLWRRGENGEQNDLSTDCGR